ncbi:MbnP family copper-binding protein [Archangium primigenium]|uniref:MbnP family copper-binding protein n=1 Tax=[Archangium] primigenium TaxID=2792470 RepID=UPI0019597C89|nr:MbnP family copper-binding protein [Archangium primigenium]MBM7113557.1 metallo-mystery pair system four-Cys motif protein [Archangium primigenium]
MMSSASRFLFVASLFAGPWGCGVSDPPEAKPVAVDIPFEARVGAEPFACGRVYTGLGTTGTTYEPKDFRVYVHDVRLVAADGKEVPVTLTDDDLWQYSGAALLDFADKTGQCSEGTQGTNTRLVGTVPEGDYRGLRLTLGLPLSLNHQDVTFAPKPFKDTGLFWGWRRGYFFTRIDGRTTGLRSGHNMHLGSTDCPDVNRETAPTGCAFPNTVPVELVGFVPGQGKVVFDLMRLFEGSNLDTNTPDTSIGCMADQWDPDCAPLFQRLGLAFGTQAANPAAQAFVRWE